MYKVFSFSLKLGIGTNAAAPFIFLSDKTKFRHNVDQMTKLYRKDDKPSG